MKSLSFTFKKDVALGLLQAVVGDEIAYTEPRWSGLPVKWHMGYVVHIQVCQYGVVLLMMPKESQQYRGIRALWLTPAGGSGEMTGRSPYCYGFGDPVSGFADTDYSDAFAAYHAAPSDEEINPANWRTLGRMLGNHSLRSV